MVNPGSTSPSLIALASDLDEDAWRRLIEQYRPWIGRICERAGVPANDVDDVAQEVLRSIVHSVGKFQPTSKGSFRRWLYTVTQRCAIDHYRVTGRKEQARGGTSAHARLANVIESADPSTRHSPGLSSSVLDQALDQVRSGCSTKTWKAFWLMTMDGWSSSEVSIELSMTQTAVRLAKFRVLGKLKQQLSEADQDASSEANSQ